MALGTGCATTHSDPPPVVAPQPPEMTAHEAMEEGEASTTAPLTEMATVQEMQSRAERFRPTTRSTQEIRDLNASAPYALDFEQRMDRVHDRIYTFGQRAVENTDHAFASRNKPLEPVPAAPFRLGTTLLLIDRAGGMKFHPEVDFDISLRLPNLEKRLRIFVSSDELDGGTRSTTGDSLLRAGLRYELVRDLDFDIGIRVALPPVAFTSLKWQKEVALGSWDFYPLVKLFAETKESVGYAMGATFDHWSGRQLVRSSSFAKWRHDLDQTAWSQTFIYARANEILVPDRYGSYIDADDIGRGFGLRLLVSGETLNRDDRYEAGVFYRGRTPKRWLYWSVEPLVRWDRAWNWNADPGIRIGIDALFWDLARPAR